MRTNKQKTNNANTIIGYLKYKNASCTLSLLGQYHCSILKIMLEIQLSMTYILYLFGAKDVL